MEPSCNLVTMFLTCQLLFFVLFFLFCYCLYSFIVSLSLDYGVPDHGETFHSCWWVGCGAVSWLTVLLGSQPGFPPGSCPLPRATCPLNDPCQLAECTVPTLGQGEPLRAAQENRLKAATPVLGNECWCYSVKDLSDIKRNLTYETPKECHRESKNCVHVCIFSLTQLLWHHCHSYYTSNEKELS